MLNPEVRMATRAPARSAPLPVWSSPSDALSLSAPSTWMISERVRGWLRAGGARELTYRLLCVLWFTIPWEGVVRFGGGATIARAAGALVAVSALVAVATSGVRHRLREFPVLTFGFATLVALSAYWTLSPSLTQARTITMAQIALMVWFAWEFAHSQRRLRGIMIAFVAGCALPALLVTLAFAQGVQTVRYTPAGTHPGDLANTLCYGIPLAWYLSLKTRSTAATVLLRLYLPLAVFAIVLTAARAALISLPLVLAIVPLTWPWLSRRARLAVAAGSSVFLAALLLAAASLSGPLGRLSTASSEIASGTLNHRTTLWGLGLDFFGQRPLLGMGAGGSRGAVGGAFNLEAGLHNAYISVAAELGAVGLVLFLVIGLTAVWPATRHAARLERRLAWVLSVILVYGLLPRHAEYGKDTWAMLVMLALIGSVMVPTVERLRSGPPTRRDPGHAPEVARSVTSG